MYVALENRPCAGPQNVKCVKNDQILGLRPNPVDFEKLKATKVMFFRLELRLKFLLIFLLIKSSNYSLFALKAIDLLLLL